MTAAVNQPHEQNHPPLAPEMFDLKQWLINPKTPKLFEHFNDKSDHYRSWSSRVKDHLMSSNLSWGRVLEVIEKQRQPLTKARLAWTAGIDEARLDMPKISQILWAFLSNHCLHNPVHERRLQLTGGEDNNGLELWRALYQENEGGAEQVIMAGIRRFQRFPKCPSKTRLQAHLGEWQSLRKQHGGHLPDVRLY